MREETKCESLGGDVGEAGGRTCAKRWHTQERRDEELREEKKRREQKNGEDKEKNPERK